MESNISWRYILCLCLCLICFLATWLQGSFLEKVLLRRMMPDAAPMPFTSCRQLFYERITKQRQYESRPPIPWPSSIFLKRENSNSTSVYIVLSTVKFNHTHHPHYVRSYSRNMYHIWVVKTAWFASINQDKPVPCSVIKRNGTVDPRHLVAVLQCPLDLNTPIVNNIPVDIYRKVDIASREELRIHSSALPACQLELPKPYYRLVATTLVAEDHIDWIPEWIEYHHMIGFEYFIIYVNQNSSARFEKMLDFYVNELKILEISIHYNNLVTSANRNSVSQVPSENDCIYQLKGRAKWLAIFDVDEFIQFYPETNSEKAKTLLEFLDSLEKRYGDLGGVQLRNWWFGYGPGRNPVRSFPKRPGDRTVLSRVNEMTWRAVNISEDNRKTIILVDQVAYFSIHKIHNGARAIWADGHRDVRLVHYRTPYISSEYESQFVSGSAPLDITMVSSFGSLIESKLTSHGFTVNETVNFE